MHCVRCSGQLGLAFSKIWISGQLYTAFSVDEFLKCNISVMSMNIQTTF
jgi:hypothetical protein